MQRRCPYCQSARLLQECRGRRYFCLDCARYSWSDWGVFDRLREATASRIDPARRVYDWIMAAP